MGELNAYNRIFPKSTLSQQKPTPPPPPPPPPPRLIKEGKEPPKAPPPRTITHTLSDLGFNFAHFQEKNNEDKI